MNFKLLLKAIGLILLCLLVLFVATLFGTLAFIEWPGITTMVLLITLSVTAIVFFINITYYWLKDRKKT